MPPLQRSTASLEDLQSRGWNHPTAQSPTHDIPCWLSAEIPAGDVARTPTQGLSLWPGLPHDKVAGLQRQCGRSTAFYNLASEVTQCPSSHNLPTVSLCPGMRGQGMDASSSWEDGKVQEECVRLKILLWPILEGTICHMHVPLEKNSIQ